MSNFQLKPNLSTVGWGPVLEMQDSDPPLLPPGNMVLYVNYEESVCT